jgi:phage minor structural protein
MANYYILDKNKVTRGVLSNDIPRGCPYFEDSYKEDYTTGWLTHEFEVPGDNKEAAKIDVEGFIIFPDFKGRQRMVKVVEVDDEAAEGTRKRIYAEGAHTVLGDDRVRPFSLDNGTPEEALGRILNNSGWEVGTIWSGDTAKIEMKDYPTILEAIQELAETFGLYPVFRVEYNELTGLLHQVVDLVQPSSRRKGKMFDFSKDMLEVTRKKHSRELYTAVLPLGKSNDNDQRLDISGVSWSVANGDPANKPPGDDIIIDPEAMKEWPNEGKPKVGRYENSNQEDPDLLAVEGWEWLQEHNKPAFEYSGKAVDLYRLTGAEHEQFDAGDVVVVRNMDFNPPMVVEAEITTTTRSHSDPSADSFEWGNYKDIYQSEKDKLDALEALINRRRGTWDVTGKTWWEGEDAPDPDEYQMWLKTGVVPNIWFKWDGVSWTRATATQPGDVGTIGESEIDKRDDQAEGNAINFARDWTPKVYSQENPPTGEIPLGSHWLNTTEKRWYKWNGSQWILNSLVDLSELEGLITGPQISIGAVAEDKLADLAVTMDKLAEDSVSNEKVLDRAMSTLKIQLDAIDNSLMAADSVNTEQIINDSITNALMATNSVGTLEVVDRALATSKIQLDAIDNTLMAVDSIQTEQVVDRAMSGLKIALNAVTNDLVADDAIKTENIVDRSMSSLKIQLDAITNDLVAIGAIGSTELGNGSVISGKLGSSAVGSGNISSGAVISGKLGTGAVGTGNIVDKALTTAKIALDAIDNTLMADGSVNVEQIVGRAVTGAKIALTTVDNENVVTRTLTADRIVSLAITANEIAATTITGAKISGSTITGGKIAGTTITGGNIAGLTITGGKMVANTLTAGEIASRTITAGLIAANAITAYEIAGRTITGDQIKANALTAYEIAGRTITAAQIVADTLTANEIKASTITAAQIAGTTITANKLVAGTLTSNEIASRSIVAGDIVANSLTAGEIATNAVTATEIASNTITASQIASRTITADRIVSNAITANEIASNTITASQIKSNTISTNNLNVLAKNLINNFSVSGTTEGWGSSHSQGVLNSGPNNVAFVTDTERGRVLRTNPSTRTYYFTERFEIDPTQDYKVTLGVKVPNNVERVYFGIETYDEDGNELGTQAIGASGDGTFDSTYNTNSYFWYSGTGQNLPDWYDMVGYVVGCNADPKDVPAGKNVSTHYRFHPKTKYLQIRFLHYMDGSEVFWYSPSVQAVSGGRITADQIVSRSITASEIATRSLTANEIATNAITSTEINARTIVAGNIVSNTLTANEIAANTITGTQIVGRSIYASDLVSGTITANEIATRTITANRIATGAITANEIAANTITANEIAANQITANHIASAGLTADVIKGGTISGVNILGDNTIIKNSIEVEGSSSSGMINMYPGWAGYYKGDGRTARFGIGGVTVGTGESVEVRLYPWYEKRSTDQGIFTTYGEFNVYNSRTTDFSFQAKDGYAFVHRLKGIDNAGAFSFGNYSAGVEVDSGASRYKHSNSDYLYIKDNVTYFINNAQWETFFQIHPEDYNHVSLRMGNGRLKGLNSGSGTIQVRTWDDADYGLLVASNVSASSMKEYKKDIEELEVDAISLIKSAKAYKYNRKFDKKGSKKHVGLIYEEAPDEIRDENGGVSLYGMSSVLWKSNQQLIKLVEDLTKRIEKLEKGNKK